MSTTVLREWVPIIHWCERVETFLACGVPDLELDHAVLEATFLCQKCGYSSVINFNRTYLRWWVLYFPESRCSQNGAQEMTDNVSTTYWTGSSLPCLLLPRQGEPVCSDLFARAELVVEVVVLTW